MAGLRRIFFMHLGGLVGIFVYFGVAGAGLWSVDAVWRALVAALLVHGAFVGLAWTQGEVKQLDIGVLVMFVVGALGMAAGAAPVVALFRRYSPALLFATLALTAVLPFAVGREQFTYYYARRQAPAWQQKLPVFHALTRLVAWLWVGVFVLAAASAAWSPADWRFASLYPSLLVVLVGLPAPLWLGPLYLRLRPPGLPPTIEGVLMGMPLAFDRRAADGVTATIQFHVTGDEPGAYHLRIDRGRCESRPGTAPAPDATIRTPAEVWMRIVRGELAGDRALAEGLYRVEGDLAVVARLETWFRRG